MKPIHILHLYNRIGVGITPKELKRLSKKPKRKVVKELFENSKKGTPISVDISYLDSIKQKDLRDSTLRQKLNKESRKKITEFSNLWFQRILSPKEVLREKMTLFWTNHFVCQNNQIQFVQQYHNTLRKHALGHFGNFAKAISKEPAMLFYLNNKQNKKGSPNENFARELMELFTLGQGQYSEKDIKEAARAFTGYNNNFKGHFKFYNQQHDSEPKTFFGKTGNFNGDDIIDIILEKRECAEFICKKIYSYFVHDTINPSHLNEMTNVFYKDYNIENLMRFILLSDWFYHDEYIGTKIKSPMEFIAGIYTIVPFEFLNPRQITVIQRVLGQVLMRPPNVAGWKTGRYWIDSNTIVTRLRLASILLNKSAITYVEKEDMNSMTGRIQQSRKKGKQYFKIKPDWKTFFKNFDNYSNKELQEHLVLSKMNRITKEELSKKDNLPLKDFCIQLMSLPEYQLC
jgi:uncharacterized protein (DUF1800 family)